MSVVAKGVLFCMKSGQKGRSRNTSATSNVTEKAMKTFHGEDISCNACYNAFSNELQIVLTVKEAAGCLVPAQLWRVI